MTTRVRTDADRQREATGKRQGKVKPLSSPLPGETVFDEDRQEYGVVARCCKGAACWVKFDSAPDEVYYSLRVALDRWLAFPGSAGAIGLRATE